MNNSVRMLYIHPLLCPTHKDRTNLNIYRFSKNWTDLHKSGPSGTYARIKRFDFRMPWADDQGTNT